jgi:hypothetical protein
MISVRRNKNFTNWIQVFSFGKFIDELSSVAKAMELAESLAKKRNLHYINVEGEARSI